MGRESFRAWGGVCSCCWRIGAPRPRWLHRGAVFLPGVRRSFCGYSWADLYPTRLGTKVLEGKRKKPRKFPGLFRYLIGRRPTLPHTRACSTIGAEELNYRVRDGNGWASSLLSPETFRTAQYGRGLKFAALSSSEISLSSGSHPRTFALNPVSIEAN